MKIISYSDIHLEFPKVSNQPGYARNGVYECGKDFDPLGAPVIIGA